MMGLCPLPTVSHLPSLWFEVWMNLAPFSRESVIKVGIGVLNRLGLALWQ